MPREATASIRIRPETKAMLERMKRPAETYDRLIRRMIEAASHAMPETTGVTAGEFSEAAMMPPESAPEVPTNPLEPFPPGR